MSKIEVSTQTSIRQKTCHHTTRDRIPQSAQRVPVHLFKHTFLSYNLDCQKKYGRATGSRGNTGWGERGMKRSTGLTVLGFTRHWRESRMGAAPRVRRFGESLRIRSQLSTLRACSPFGLEIHLSPGQLNTKPKRIKEYLLRPSFVRERVVEQKLPDKHWQLEKRATQADQRQCRESRLSRVHSRKRVAHRL
jgi:hypothetical protein